MFLNNAMDFCREMETCHFWPIFEEIWQTAVRGSKCLSKCYKSFGMKNSQSRPKSEFVALPLLWDARGHSAI